MTGTSLLFRALVLAACLLPACLESNPQPSPGGSGGDEAKWTGSDTVAPSMDSIPADALGGEGNGEVSDTTAGEVPEIVDTTDSMDSTDTTDSTDSTDTTDSTDGVDSCGSKPVDCAPCQVPYAGCICYEGQWVCVQCTEDEHCPGTGCTCDTTTFSCTGNCSAPDCVENEDCLFEGGPTGLLCHGETGTCYDPDGTCDQIVSKCLDGAECVDLLGNPGLPGPGLFNLCACETPLPLIDAVACLPDGTCPDSEGCYPGQVCTEIDLLCTFLEGCPDPAYGGGVCVGTGLLDFSPLN